MKEGWRMVKLGEVCQTFNGLWKGKKPPFVTIGVLRSTNFTKDCRLKLDDVAYIEVEEKAFSKRKLEKYDVVVERSGGGPNQPVGRVLLFDIDDDNFSFCNFTSALRVIDTENLSPIYLHRYLIYFYFSGKTLDMQSNTIGLRNLDYAKYLEIEIPLPPLPEQERIVSILDAEFAKIDAVKAGAEKNLQHAKDLFQAALKKELTPKEGWKTKKLGEVCTLSQGLAINAQTRHLIVEKSALPLLRIKDLKENSREIFVDEVKCPESCRVFPDEIIYTRTGTLGLVFTGFYGVMHNNCFKVILDKSLVTKMYIIHYLQSSQFKNNIISFAKRAAQPDITHKLFKEQSIPLPPLPEQEQIVTRLDTLNTHCKALQANYERTIALCDDMKQALLRKAFNGEL